MLSQQAIIFYAAASKQLSSFAATSWREVTPRHSEEKEICALRAVARLHSTIHTADKARVGADDGFTVVAPSPQ